MLAKVSPLERFQKFVAPPETSPASFQLLPSAVAVGPLPFKCLLRKSR